MTATVNEIAAFNNTNHSFMAMVFLGWRMFHVFSFMMVASLCLGAVVMLVFCFGRFNLLT